MTGSGRVGWGGGGEWEGADNCGEGGGVTRVVREGWVGVQRRR